MNLASPPQSDRPNIPEDYGISRDTAGMLPWSWAEEALEKSKNYWVCTTWPDGRPHSMPVWGLWISGAFYFSTGRTSRKARNLAENEMLAVHLESGDEVVIVEGAAEEITKKQELERLLEPYKAKYKIDAPLLDPLTVNYRLRPKKAFGWRENDYPKSATRWIFDERGSD